MHTRPDKPIDPEVADLVARFLDERLDSDQLARLDEHLRTDADIREYCAERLRFSAALRENLEPQRLEFLETRRTIIERGATGPEWSVEQQRSVRYGKDRTSMVPVLPASIRQIGRWKWGIAGASFVLGAAAVIAIILLRKPAAPPAHVPQLVLRNGKLEATDLSLSPRGISTTLIDWQDPYSVALAELCEVGRTSNGRIFAKSGKNVAHLLPMGYLMQELSRDDGGKLLATADMKTRVSGWAYVDSASPMYLKCSLTFIASGRPDTIRYEATKSDCLLNPGGWHHFQADLVLGADLTRLPIYTAAVVKNKSALDLSGRPLYLMIERRGQTPYPITDIGEAARQGELYLDDLNFETVR